MKTSRVVISTISLVKCTLLSLLLSGATAMLHGEVTLETQAKITDFGLHFNGKKLTRSTLDQVDTGPEKYDYFFGRSISAHGDCVKTYKNFVFMSWYRGGKNDRRVMLSRYDTDTGEVATIAFPHRHIGYKSDPLIGESHNTIGIAISPLNGTIHMLYDMHGSSYRNFRYSYSEVGAASAPHAEFTLDLFKKDTTSSSTGDDDYIHSYMTGNPADDSKFGGLTYPQFFTNDDGVLIMYMRKGGSNNGAYQFNRYDAPNERWTNLVDFNVQNAKTNHGNAYNWGLYGSMKYINGKLRVAFQQRTDIKSDRYLYQNGVYYAYSDDQEGKGQWHNHEGEPMTFPLVNTDEIKVFEPGDYISHTEKDSVYIVSPFDFTVTAKGDIHIISKVRSTDRSRSDYKEVYIHSYKPHDADAFVYDTNFSGGDALYTSGDYIYMIGLKSGRPFIKKAKGGTHEFETVYQAEGGLTFDHGVVYIDKGKVYYYLLEKGSSSALPLHLQIIDLGIENDIPADTEIDAAVQIANDGSVVIRVDRIGNITFELVWSRNLVHWTRLDSQTEESEKTVDFIVPPEVMDAPAFFKVGVEQ